MRKRVGLAVAIIILVGLAVGGYLLFNLRIRPYALEYAEAQLSDRALSILNQAVEQAILETENVEDIIQVEKDENGNIAMIQIEQKTVNLLCTQASLNTLELSQAMVGDMVYMPLGNALDSDIFSGQGPLIGIRIVSAGSTNAEYHTEFESCGINQTRYKLYLSLQLTTYLSVGSYTTSFPSETEILVADTIIVGDVPDTYADVADGDGFLNLVP